MAYPICEKCKNRFLTVRKTHLELCNNCLCERIDEILKLNGIEVNIAVQFNA